LYKHVAWFAGSDGTSRPKDMYNKLHQDLGMSPGKAAVTTFLTFAVRAKPTSGSFFEIDVGNALKSRLHADTGTFDSEGGAPLQRVNDFIARVDLEHDGKLSLAELKKTVSADALEKNPTNRFRRFYDLTASMAGWKQLAQIVGTTDANGKPAIAVEDIRLFFGEGEGTLFGKVAAEKAGVP
jgi:Caleosin related protein